MEKEKIQEVLQKSSDFAKKLANLLVLLLTLSAGLVIGYYACQLSQKKEAKVELEQVKSIGETSVAINERSELLIIDRTTGAYKIYDDSVGTAIFNMYAGKMYMRQASK